MRAREPNAAPMVAVAGRERLCAARARANFGGILPSVDTDARDERRDEAVIEG